MELPEDLERELERVFGERDIYEILGGAEGDWGFALARFVQGIIVQLGYKVCDFEPEYFDGLISNYDVWGEILDNFVLAWDDVVYPQGVDPLVWSYEEAVGFWEAGCIPDCLPGKLSISPASTRRNAILLWMIRILDAGEGRKFFLPTRKTADLLDVTPVTVARTLKKLQKDEIIQLVEKAIPNHKAARYKYTGPDKPSLERLRRGRRGPASAN